MSKRYPNFDILRGMAILAVVIIHVTASAAVDGITRAVVLNQLARFGVPVFVFLSGWGLTVANSYRRSENYFAFLKNRLSKIIPGYLLWNVIYIIYNYFFQGEMLTFQELIMGVLRGTHFPHLYFVPLIVLFYLFYPFLLKLGKTNMGLLVSLVATFYSLIATWGVTIEGFTRNHNPLNWLFYFVFGIWVAEYYERIREKLNKNWLIPLLILSLSLVILEPTELTEEVLLTQTRPSVVFYSIVVILLSIVVSIGKSNFNRFFIELSNQSYQIYLSHYLFIRIFREVFPNVHPLVLLPMVLLSSYLLSKINKRITAKN